MKNLWNETEAKKLKNDLLKQRVYSSRLLGANEDLVMHGGGNTSVKITKKNLFGEAEELLFVKGSGWDLGTIEAEGFAPVKMDTLLKMADLKELSDMDMVKYQRAAMTDPSAPNPSVEAIMHAIIPFTFVDHTHADAIVTITNSPNGKKKIQEIFGERMLIVPYVMPGFILAKTIHKMTKNLDWASIDGMILLNHGVFSFHNNAKESYDQMIKIVSKAERYLKQNASDSLKGPKGNRDANFIARSRKKVSELWGSPVLAKMDNSVTSSAFSSLKNVKKIGTKGPITPDHIIRTKQNPVVLGKDLEADLDQFAEKYRTYFKENKLAGQQILDQAPRWAIVPNSGSIFYGKSIKNAQIIEDIARHTQKAIFQAEQLGGWRPLGQADLFEMEYWSLEQAKLAKGGQSKEMQGKIAVVTGAASGIGKACVEQLLSEGAVVAALDIDPVIESVFNQNEVLPIKCDLTNSTQIKKAIDQIVFEFGGLDMVISNAGIFPKSAEIEAMPEDTWEKSLAVNVTSHQRFIQYCLPFLELGIDPAIVIMGSKNVPAPGPGAAAYSVAKAGLTQLARIAAMEFGKKGIRVNVLHPNAVYDTGIWTEEVLKARAKHYKLSVKAYKTNNIMSVEVTSKDVAQLAVNMLSSTFSKVTGAQVPIDGGNDRVI
jgi:rhamnose utilization protein RhaD (predicted bifunctional aldolase and dehydrogenase)/NAD(P)-dependent dehydrogenase (short-subunit alcohol dehydrogenase family)